MNRIVFLFITLLSLTTMGAIKNEMVEYKQGDTTLEGYLVHNPAVRMKQPAVIIVHAWMGLDDFVKQKADEMAKMGYVAFAADIYGKGQRPKDQKEAAEMSGKYKADRALLRARAQAALDQVMKNPKVDRNKIVAMGYCFGGTTVLEMAMAGLPLAGVVSFHGGLDFPKTLADTKNIKGQLLILHGAIDPFVPADQVATFTKALNDNKINYEFIAYSGAVHSFTHPTAGNDISKGQAYNAVADRRSTEDMKDFFRELTGAPGTTN